MDPNLLSGSWPIPYIPDPSGFALDAFVSFCVAVLLAILVHAEAQAFASTMLGDRRVGAKDRFHFIAFFHLDIIGSICFLVGGFGWPKVMDVDPAKFKLPRLYTLISRLAGPLANLLLANIAASIVFLLGKVEVDARVFTMVLGVNVTMAVYNLVPIPPLAAGTALVQILPPSLAGLSWLLMRLGPFLVLAWALVERLVPGGLASPYLNAWVLTAMRFIVGL